MRKNKGEKLNLLSEEEIKIVLERFKSQNPNPKCKLKWKNPFTLLVAVVLSAQSTDKSVNENTKTLFEVADTPEKMVTLGREKLIEYIKPIGLSNAKSKNIISLSQKLITDFQSQVPHDREKLMQLSGVGRKTANVVLNVVWNEPTMPVDTHLLRICPKIGLAEGDTPETVEQSLLKRIPQEYLINAHHWLILHGRYICTARNPKCKDCSISDICKKNEKD